MPIFLAVPLVASNAALTSAVETKIDAKSRYKLQADRGWLIQYGGTTIELCALLGLTKGSENPIGSTIVSPISGYYGRGPADMWEWLKTRFEQ